jgi:hypothetical protein
VWDQDGPVKYASLLNLLPSSDTFSPVVAVYLMEVGDVFQLDVMTLLGHRDGPREGKRSVWTCRRVLMVRESDVMSLRGLRKLVRRLEEPAEGCFEGNRGHVCIDVGQDVYIKLYCLL